MRETGGEVGLGTRATTSCPSLCIFLGVVSLDVCLAPQRGRVDFETGLDSVVDGRRLSYFLIFVAWSFF